tara:strand:- start:1777 stop:2439 length:663 start_codon:yes stop_codon:yes gene_type:complete
MKILVFDTETTGLPERNASIYDNNKWPHIIQLSYIFYDISNNISVIKDEYIRINTNIEINEESFKIHNISHDILKNKGINIRTAINDFNKFLDLADVVVGHNLSFDKRMMFVECIRNKMQQKFTKFDGNNKITKPEFCTMKNTIDFCGLYYTNRSGKKMKKNPTLSELFLKLFPEEVLPNNLHNSIVDVAITIRCYIKYNYNIDISSTNQDIGNIFTTLC